MTFSSRLRVWRGQCCHGKRDLLSVSQPDHRNPFRRRILVKVSEEFLDMNDPFGTRTGIQLRVRNG
jgi:hypothetical protein